jgi:hypothetical protein
MSEARLERLAQIHEYLLGVVEGADPVLTGTALEPLNGTLDNLSSPMAAILANKLTQLKSPMNMASERGRFARQSVQEIELRSIDWE